MPKRQPPQAPGPKPHSPVRCAIYTRKSTDDGLDQEFNSLDAQREAAEAYIRSQAGEGWTLVPDRYDDGGFTGGNLDRPALRHLLADIEAGKVDCVVVYKVDRLSRSLLDFARLMETFERHGMSFVSVTQQFNTATSMGRLILNVLLSFAQFEREIIGERIRDKIAATRRRGKWTGGTPILGYDVDRSNGRPRLVVNAQEAARGRKRLQDKPAVGTPLPTGRVPRVSRVMALAIQFDRLLREGVVRNTTEHARLCHVTQPRITQVMQLLHLAPDIQQAVVFLPRVERGRAPITERDLRSIAAILDWRQQRAMWAAVKSRQAAP